MRVPTSSSPTTTPTRVAHKKTQPSSLAAKITTRKALETRKQALLQQYALVMELLDQKIKQQEQARNATLLVLSSSLTPPPRYGDWRRSMMLAAQEKESLLLLAKRDPLVLSKLLSGSAK